jgi:hypothetical protein
VLRTLRSWTPNIFLLLVAFFGTVGLVLTLYHTGYDNGLIARYNAIYRGQSTYTAPIGIPSLLTTTCDTDAAAPLGCQFHLTALGIDKVLEVYFQ